MKQESDKATEIATSRGVKAALLTVLCLCAVGVGAVVLNLHGTDSSSRHTKTETTAATGSAENETATETSVMTAVSTAAETTTTTTASEPAETTVSTSAAKEAADDPDSGKCGENTVWELDRSGVLTIKGTGAMDEYKDGETPWYKKREEIKRVIVEEGVTEITRSAFKECAVETVELPDSLKTIGKAAFFHCEYLQKITIPKNVESIGERVFIGCTGLWEINVDDDNKYFMTVDGALTDRGGTKLLFYPPASDKTYYNIPCGITEIGLGAFYQCVNLLNVGIPEEVETIGGWAFWGCVSLNGVHLPQNLREIGDFAFENCTGMRLVLIPENVSYIGEGAFGYLCKDEVTDELDESFYINCYKGSVGEQYAVNNGIDYSCIAKPDYQYDYDPADIPVFKPVIYLYPEKKTDINVKVEPAGEFWTTYPKYGADGWNVTAYPDGRIVNKADGHTYDYLFWDATGDDSPYDMSRGFCVKGEDTEAFLREKLTEIGLNEREMNEFIVYWLPLMEHNKHNVIAFQGETYAKNNKLTVTPAPDSVLRVFMTYRAVGHEVKIQPQTFERFERKGFTVVEWGGSDLDRKGIVS